MRKRRPFADETSLTGINPIQTPNQLAVPLFEDSLSKGQLTPCYRNGPHDVGYSIIHDIRDWLVFSSVGSTIWTYATNVLLRQSYVG